MSRAKTLSFRAEPAFAREIASNAKIARQNRSDYVKQAVSERNERTLAKRVAFLSRSLSARSHAVYEELDTAAGDGLAWARTQINLANQRNAK